MRVTSFDCLKTTFRRPVLAYHARCIDWLQHKRIYPGDTHIFHSPSSLSSLSMTCDKPLLKVRGCRFDIGDVKVHRSPYEHGHGQIMHMAMKGMYASLLMASPAVLEPVYRCEISCPQVCVTLTCSCPWRRKVLHHVYVPKMRTVSNPREKEIVATTA